MKTNVLLVSALLASSLFLGTSCKKDDNSVAPVIQENNIPNGTIKIGYSVQVIASSVAARTEGLSGAVVTIQGDNGFKQSATTDETGIASFTNLNEGRISIFVKSPSGDFLSSNVTGDLKYTAGIGGSLTVAGTNGGGNGGQNNTGTDANVVANNQLPVTLPRRAAAVAGKLFYQNPSNSVYTAAQGAKLIAKADAKFEPNLFTATVGSDGSFNIGSLPEGVNLTWTVDFTTDITQTGSNPNNIPTFKKSWSLPGSFTNAVNSGLSGGKVTEQGLVTLN